MVAVTLPNDAQIRWAFELFASILIFNRFVGNCDAFGVTGVLKRRYFYCDMSINASINKGDRLAVSSDCSPL